MVKFGKSKFKALNKIAKKQKTDTNAPTNKVLKKKLNADKKVSFQKEVLLKEVAASGSPLVTNVSSRKVLLDELSKKAVKKKSAPQEDVQKPKLKPVQKHKKRQKTQIDDTKMLLKLMNKK
uniref:Uncharacterized protein n=1 Tax=Pectinophora gossypiella TaxID=13191 RepID=A0A1E1W9Y5_PECGO